MVDKNTNLSQKEWEELENRMRKVMRSELQSFGFDLNDSYHARKIREDIRFAGRMRKTVEGAAAKIGATIILVFVGGVIYLFQLGVQAWIRVSGGG